MHGFRSRNMNYNSKYSAGSIPISKCSMKCTVNNKYMGMKIITRFSVFNDKLSNLSDREYNEL